MKKLLPTTDFFDLERDMQLGQELVHLLTRAVGPFKGYFGPVEVEVKLGDKKTVKKRPDNWIISVGEGGYPRGWPPEMMETAQALGFQFVRDEGKYEGKDEGKDDRRGWGVYDRAGGAVTRMKYVSSGVLDYRQPGRRMPGKRWLIDAIGNLPLRFTGGAPQLQAEAERASAMDMDMESLPGEGTKLGGLERDFKKLRVGVGVKLRKRLKKK